MSTNGAPRVGIIGFGEVGSALGRGLRSEGLPGVVAADAAAEDATFGPLIRRRAAEATVELLPTNAEVAEVSDLVLVAVPGWRALEAAEQTAPGLRKGQLYVDVGSASPRVKQALAEVVERAGGSAVDVAILSTPLIDQHRIATLASGRAAEQYRDLLTPYGFNIRVVGERAGQAAAIKMLRSVLMKGIESLLIESLLASRRHGVEDVVFETVAEFFDKGSFLEMCAVLLRTDAIHAERRAHEADMMAEVVREVGITPRLSPAIAETLHWSAGLGLKQHFGGEVPDDWKVVVDAMLERLDSPEPSEPRA
jgi:3-hydroxyisobutyrate dehydrogenase-like beta-hydroxyacid dehydrogenase